MLRQRLFVLLLRGIYIFLYFFGADCVSCPAAYTLVDGACFIYSPATADRIGARAACQNGFNGWLATLDSATKMGGVLSTFGLDTDTYFGLYKTTSCTGNFCNGNLIWDRYLNGTGPPVVYTDMGR